MLIDHAPPKKVTEPLVLQPPLPADPTAMSLPDQDTPPPETRMFGVALLLSVLMLLLIAAAVALVL
jgi:hypothetical protein